VELLGVLALRNLKVTNALYALAVILFITYFAVLYFQPIQEKTFINYLKILPTAISIDTAVIIVFAKYLWKWGIFKEWLVPFPNLNGTYQGTIKTTWEDPITGERPAPIQAYLTISQSFFNISCVMRTEEMTSHSFIGDFILDKDNQVKRLSYSYVSHPKQIVIERSPLHQGTIVFDIAEGHRPRLIGQYWTGRKTTGTIEMKFWKKDKLDSFPSKKVGMHPVSGARNNKS
jgi:hypothetical protein